MTQIPVSLGQIDYDLPCFRCEHNLRSVAVAGACPRCGESVALSEQGFREHVDDTGRVKGDMYCPKCGYNVRSLDAKGVCSECGTPVTQALRGSQLRFADPRWVRGLSRGMLYMILSMAAAVALYAVFVAIVMFAVFRGQIAPGASPFGGPAQWVPMLVALLGVVGLNIAGLLSVSRKEPRSFSAPEGWNARRMVRITTLMLPIAVLMGILNGIFQGVTPSGMKLALTLLTVATFVVSALGWWLLPLALVRLFVALLKRIPSPALVRFAKIEFWCMLVSGAIFVVAYALFLTAMISQGPALQAWQAQVMAQAGTAGQFPYAGTGPGGTNSTGGGIEAGDVPEPEVLDFTRRESVVEDNSRPNPVNSLTGDSASEAQESTTPSQSPASPAAPTTTVGPVTVNGSTGATTAANPAAIPPFPMSPAMIGLMAAYGLSGCVFSAAGLAYVVLIILVWRAFAKTAKETAAFAAVRAA